MKKLWIPITIVILISVALLGVGLVAWGIGTYNEAASQKNLYNMKVKDNTSEFDNMAKQIFQAIGIADTKKESFKEVYGLWAKSGTPEDSGKMMLWLKQATPDLKGMDIYDKAMDIMVGSRNGWTMRQKELVQIATTYNDSMVRFPKGPFLKLFGFELIDPKVITSSRTEKAFETGKDDDVGLRTFSGANTNK